MYWNTSPFKHWKRRSLINCFIYVLLTTSGFLRSHVWKLAIFWMRWLSSWIALAFFSIRRRQWLSRMRPNLPKPKPLRPQLGWFSKILPRDGGQKSLGSMLTSRGSNVEDVDWPMSSSAGIESFSCEPVDITKHKCVLCLPFTALWKCSAITGMLRWRTSLYLQLTCGALRQSSRMAQKWSLECSGEDIAVNYRKFSVRNSKGNGWKYAC